MFSLGLCWNLNLLYVPLDLSKCSELYGVIWLKPSNSTQLWQLPNEISNLKVQLTSRAIDNLTVSAATTKPTFLAKYIYTTGKSFVKTFWRKLALFFIARNRLKERRTTSPKRMGLSSRTNCNIIASVKVVRVLNFRCYLSILSDRRPSVDSEPCEYSLWVKLISRQ